MRGGGARAGGHFGAEASEAGGRRAAHQTRVKKRFCQVRMPFSPRFCINPA